MLLPLAALIAFALPTDAVVVAVVVADGDDAALGPFLRAAVAEQAGLSVLDPAEVDAAKALLASQGVTCGVDDVPCFAKLAVITDARAVLTARALGGGAFEVLAVDAAPRAGRARAASSSELARAVVAALAELEIDDRRSAAGKEAVAGGQIAADGAPREQGATDAPRSPTQASAPDLDAAARATGPVATGPVSSSPWPLLGAGLAGAGVIALAAGGVATAGALQSISEAEAARFQDDSARFGDEANGRLWLGGGAFAVGVAAVAAGAALVVAGGEP